MNQNTLVNAQMVSKYTLQLFILYFLLQRSFAKKKGRGKKNAEAATTDDEAAEAVPEEEPVVEEVVEEVVPEPVPEPTPVPQADFSGATKAQEPEKVDSSLFTAFSVGDIKKVQSTPDHKPPTQEDTIEGRYASVLFTSASEQEALYTIYEDMEYIRSLYENSESFKLFTQNAGVGNKEIHQFNQALSSVGDFHPLTIKFLEVLAENKRLTFIRDIADRYQKLYQQFNKEEKITIISAEPLNSTEQGEVLAALKANPQNEGKEFTLDFTVDPSIKGGLQMYTETEFMDMSLSSRIDKLKSEVSKLIE